MNNNIINEEQKGCRKGAMGCKEQLVIDSVILKQTQVKNRNLYCSYIDYQKAYDLIPHSWILQVLSIYKINENISNFLKLIMCKWCTTLKTTSRNHAELPPTNLF